MNFEDFVGKHILQGVDLGIYAREDWFDRLTNANGVQITLDGKTYRFIEDPEDGYRSYCDDPIEVAEPCRTVLPDIEVICKYDQNYDGCASEVLRFIDCANGKDILIIGTTNVDDWYPYCVFKYYPENMACNERVNEEEEEESKDTEFLSQLFEYAKTEISQIGKREQLNNHEFLGDLDYWSVTAIYENCTIKDGCLFNNKGVMLSDDGGCMNESIPYFVNQTTGYCGDDYYGTMFVCVAEGTFVAIHYNC